MVHEVVTDVSHEGVDIGTGVIACYLGMEVSPRAFDAVVVRAIRRQEVQPEALALICGETHGDLCGRMNAVVVQDQVNHLRPRIAQDQLPEQQDEQQAVLLFPSTQISSPVRTSCAPAR